MKEPKAADVAAFFKDMFAGKSPGKNSGIKKHARTTGFVAKHELREIKILPYLRKGSKSKYDTKDSVEDVPFSQLPNLDAFSNVNKDEKEKVAQENEKSELEVEISEPFYEQDFDPVKEIFRKMKSTSSTDELITLIPDEMAFVGTRLRFVNKQLHELIRKHYNECLQGMRTVQDIDLNITRASLYTKNARKCLNRFRDKVITGDLKVLVYYQRKERAQAVVSAIKVLKLFVKKKGEVEEALRKHELTKAVQLYFHTIPYIETENSFSCLLSMQALRKSLTMMLPTLRSETDKLLAKNICVFTQKDYEVVINAYLELDKRQHNVARWQEKGLDESVPEVLKLPMKLENAFVKECEDALRQALIAVVRGCENIEKKQDLSYVQARGLTLSELCNKVTKSCTNPSLVRALCIAYERVCFAMYNYNLITQWHVENKIESGLASSSTAEQLTLNRSSMWSKVQLQLKLVLESPVCQYPNLNVTSFHNLFLITTALVDNAASYSGNTNVLSARALIRGAAKSYAQNFHKDNLEIMKSFLKQDDFKPSKISFHSLGGLEAVLNRSKRKNLRRESSLEESLQPILDSITTWDMTKYEKDGNPFSQVVAALADMERIGPSENNNDSFEKEENGEQIMETPSSHTEGHILSTTIINCLVKNVGNYLLMMEKLPIVASDTFTNLRELYISYMVAILTNFVRKEELEEIFDSPGSLMGLKFQRLRQYITLVNISTSGKIHAGNVSQVPQHPVILKPFDERSSSVSYTNLVECVVAAESMSAAMEVLIFVRPEVERLLSSVERARQTAETYSDMATAIEDLKSLMYKSNLTEMIEKESSAYAPSKYSESSCSEQGNLTHWLSFVVGGTDAFEQEPRLYVGYLEKLMLRVFKKIEDQVELIESHSKSLLTELWSIAAEGFFEKLLEFFLRIESSSTQMKATMAEDVEVIFEKLERIHEMNEAAKAHKSRFVSYLRAFYYDREEDLNDWIRKNQRDFEPHHLDILRKNLNVNGDHD